MASTETRSPPAPVPVVEWDAISFSEEQTLLLNKLSAYAATWPDEEEEEAAPSSALPSPLPLPSSLPLGLVSPQSFYGWFARFEGEEGGGEERSGYADYLDLLSPYVNGLNSLHSDLRAAHERAEAVGEEQKRVEKLLSGLEQRAQDLLAEEVSFSLSLSPLSPLAADATLCGQCGGDFGAFLRV